jgi:hypothetical protein
VSGPAAGSTKLLVFLPKRPDISDASFHRHWRTTHAVLACRITMLQRYGQAHRLSPGLAGFPPAPFEDAPFLGVSEAWLPDAATVDAMAVHPEYVDGARADEANFVDVTAKCNLICEERVGSHGVPKLGPGGVKTFFLLRRPPSSGPAAFREQWSDPGMWAAVAATPNLAGYAECWPVPATYSNRRRAPFDAVVELWWSGVEGLTQDLGSVVARLVGDGRAPIGPGSMALAATEHRVIWP